MNQEKILTSVFGDIDSYNLGYNKALEEVEKIFIDAKRIGAKVWLVPDKQFQNLKR